MGVLYDVVVMPEAAEELSNSNEWCLEHGYTRQVIDKTNKEVKKSVQSLSFMPSRIKPLNKKGPERCLIVYKPLMKLIIYTINDRKKTVYIDHILPPNSHAY